MELKRQSAMLPRIGDGWGQGVCPGRVRCTSLGIFCTYRFNFCRGLWPHSLTHFGSGGRSLPGWLPSLNPARPSTARRRWNALFTRGRSIFLGLRHQAQRTASCRLSRFESAVPEPVAPDFCSPSWS